MKKTTILIALFFVLLFVNVSASPSPRRGGSFIVGTIYLGEMAPGNEVGGANVNATCDGYPRPISMSTVSSTEEGLVGDYVIRFPYGRCKDGSDVHVEATYGDITGSADGVMDGSLVGGLHISIINVLIPEFTTITAGIALLGSILGISLIRRRRE